MRTRIGALLGATALLLSLVWPAGPAAAAAEWPAAACATGGFGTPTTDGEHIFVPATITLCEAWTRSPRFTVAGFRAGTETSVVYGDTLRAYPEAGGPATITVDLTFAVREDIGLCLMRSVKDRIACVRVPWNQFGSVLAAIPIRTSDALVDATILYDDSDSPFRPGPWCGTCLRIVP